MDNGTLETLAARLLGGGPSAEFERRSGRLLNEISHAQITAAQNLLTKAARSLSAGDDQRAQRLIERAAQLPYDPRERSSPGIRGAQVLIHGAIVDRMGECEPDDDGWLDVVLEVHPHLDATGRTQVASTVHGLVLQRALYEATPAEARRIRAVFGDAPLEPDLGDGPDATVEERRAVIGSLTAAFAALVDAYATAADNR